MYAREAALITKQKTNWNEYNHSLTRSHFLHKEGDKVSITKINYNELADMFPEALNSDRWESIAQRVYENDVTECIPAAMESKGIEDGDYLVISLADPRTKIIKAISRYIKLEANELFPDIDKLCGEVREFIIKGVPFFNDYSLARFLENTATLQYTTTTMWRDKSITRYLWGDRPTITEDLFEELKDVINTKVCSSYPELEDLRGLLYTIEARVQLCLAYGRCEIKE